MKRSNAAIIAGVLLVFVAVGGFVAFYYIRRRDKNGGGGSGTSPLPLPPPPGTKTKASDLIYPETINVFYANAGHLVQLSTQFTDKCTWKAGAHSALFKYYDASKAAPMIVQREMATANETGNAYMSPLYFHLRVGDNKYLNEKGLVEEHAKGSDATLFVYADLLKQLYWVEKGDKTKTHLIGANYLITCGLYWTYDKVNIQPQADHIEFHPLPRDLFLE